MCSRRAAPGAFKLVFSFALLRSCVRGPSQQPLLQGQQLNSLDSQQLETGALGLWIHSSHTSRWPAGGSKGFVTCLYACAEHACLSPVQAARRLRLRPSVSNSGKQQQQGGALCCMVQSISQPAVMATCTPRAAGACTHAHMHTAKQTGHPSWYRLLTGLDMWHCGLFCPSPGVCTGLASCIPAATQDSSNSCFTSGLAAGGR